MTSAIVRFLYVNTLQNIQGVNKIAVTQNQSYMCPLNHRLLLHITLLYSILEENRLIGENIKLWHINKSKL